MRRKIYQELLQWKQRSGESALLVQGARRVGKSYIVEAFAKAEYKSYILIDFNLVDQPVKEMFEHDLVDLKTFFMKLTTYYGVKLYERESLIIFDEVQLFPRARSAIKYLVADGRYDYIETGSLISIRENVKDILIPSEEDHVDMYPLDFEEFLWANGNDTMMDFIRDCYRKKAPLGQALHRKAMDLFRQYLIVGGMPQAVNAFVKHNDFDEVDRVKRRILNLYRDDMLVGWSPQETASPLPCHRLTHKTLHSQRKWSVYVHTGRLPIPPFFYMAETGVFSICAISVCISPPLEHFLMRLFHVEYRRRR